jgi:ribonuclease-3
MSEDVQRALELRALAARLGVSVRDTRILDQALTHSSTAADGPTGARHYESLEFLGDAALGLAVAHYLYEHIPDRTPGEYSRMRANLVNRRCLARAARRLNIAPAIRLGKGEELAGGRQRAALLADCLEALVAAVYLEEGWDAARTFVETILKEDIEEAQSSGKVWDYKSRLQHYCQALRMPLPEFVLLHSEGPDHCKEFEVEVRLHGQPCGRGVGLRKKDAEQNAARAALEREGQCLDSSG